MKPQENHETGGKKMEKDIIGQQFKIQCWDSVCLHTTQSTTRKLVYSYWPTFYKLTNYKTHKTYKQS